MDLTIEKDGFFLASGCLVCWFLAYLLMVHKIILIPLFWDQLKNILKQIDVSVYMIIPYHYVHVYGHAD